MRRAAWGLVSVLCLAAACDSGPTVADISPPIFASLDEYEGCIVVLAIDGDRQSWRGDTCLHGDELVPQRVVTPAELEDVRRAFAALPEIPPSQVSRFEPLNAPLLSDPKSRKTVCFAEPNPGTHWFALSYITGTEHHDWRACYSPEGQLREVYRRATSLMAAYVYE